MFVARAAASLTRLAEGILNGTAQEALERISRIFASADAPRDLIARLRPLLPGFVSRFRIWTVEWSKIQPSAHMFEHAWILALQQHVDPDGRTPCGNASCSVFATNDAIFKACSRCRWAMYCSLACLVRLGPLDRSDSRGRPTGAITSPPAPSSRRKDGVPPCSNARRFARLSRFVPAGVHCRRCERLDLLCMSTLHRLLVAALARFRSISLDSTHVVRDSSSRILLRCPDIVSQTAPRWRGPTRSTATRASRARITMKVAMLSCRAVAPTYAALSLTRGRRSVRIERLHPEGPASAAHP